MPVTVTLETFYTGGGCHEHFSNHFWLRSADLAAIGIPSDAVQKSAGALEINGKKVNIARMAEDKAGSGCTGCCDGCPLTIFQIAPFSISDLNLRPGSNASIAYSSTPAPPLPPPPPKMEATGAIRVGDFKLLVGPPRMATWFGMFSPNATFNGTSAGTTACADRPCLFNIAQDPNEHVDLADTDPTKAAELLKTFYSYNNDFHPGEPPGSDHDGYCAAAAAHKGFMVPWRTAPSPGMMMGAVSNGWGDPMEGMTEAQQAAFIAGGGM